MNGIYNNESLPEIIEENGSYTLPQGYVFALVNYYGRGSILPVPVAYLSANAAGGLEGSCSCSCTEGSCELKGGSILGSGAIWCEGECTGTCTLTVEGISNPAQLVPTLEYKITSFEF